jgi:carbamoyl-phosphate synthase large subunit
MSDHRVTVLVTGVGAIIGYGIINALRQSTHAVRIVGMDIYDDAYGRFLADDFVKAEPAASPGYLDFVNNTIGKYSVDLIIPGIEQDLYALHKNLAKLRSGVKIVMNNDVCIHLSKSKLDTYNYFKSSNINLIPTLHNAGFRECADKFSLPFLIKPIFGYASKGIARVSTEEEFLFYSKKLNNQCIYQKIIGSIESEYTISVFGDGQGSFFDSIILKRQLSQEGATSKAILVDRSDSIMAYVTEICKRIKPVGPTNVQLRTENDVPYLLEINPRISSACSIRALMGYNEPAMCIEYFLQGNNPSPQPKRKASVVRYISDYVHYE